MPRFDLDLDELRKYTPSIGEPSDFDEFWATSIAEARAIGGDVVVTRAETFLSLVDVYDVTFPGFAGDPIGAWLIVPAGAQGPLPAVVTFVGYGGGRGLPSEHLAWANAGYAHLCVDTRGQGSVWGNGGVTGDPHGTGPAALGVMTRGVERPQDYYYRRVYVDAVRAVDAVRSLECVDAARVAVTGYSQGGAIALAAAALADGLAAATINVPFLCHIQRAVGMTGNDPYQELVRYLSVHRDSEEMVFSTLSYIDGVNLAKRAQVPALFSTALLDQTCPPSTVFAAFNHYRGADKEIKVYRFNEHEGGQAHHLEREAEFLAARLR